MIPNFLWTVVDNNILTTSRLALSHQLDGACICEKQNTALEGKWSPSQQVTCGAQIGTAALRCAAASGTILTPAHRAEQSPLTSWLLVPSLTS